MVDRVNILCYGDSNTWGCIGRWKESDLPEERYSSDQRWPGVLQRELGKQYHVIEEGLCGRTTIYSPPDAPWRNGEAYLLPCLQSHSPLDLVIMMLGTNDLLYNQQMTPEHLGDGVAQLIDIIQENPRCGRQSRTPRLLILAPPFIKRSAPEGRIAVYQKFRSDVGRDLSLRFSEVYGKIAAEKGCWFMNAAGYAAPCDADGVHMDEASHLCLGKAVAEFVKSEFQKINR